ncbi:hypothetical protein [Bradyrhizobium aeschynomenes]|nr:hypothetical protein [Bradyrhizobium aeschynomenes]
MARDLRAILLRHHKIEHRFRQIGRGKLRAFDGFEEVAQERLVIGFGKP